MRAVTERGLSTHDQHPWLLNMHGLAHMNLGNLTEAKQAFSRAKEAASKLTPEDWGKAYPGNDDRLYATGLDEFRAAIEENLRQVNARIINSEAE